MKIFSISLLSLLCTSLVFGQSVESLKSFRLSLYRSFSLSSEEKSDTCFSEFSILVVTINKAYIVEDLSFSDVAPKWQKTELQRIKKKLSLDAISAYAKEKKFSGKLIFPFIIRKEIKGCNNLNYLKDLDVAAAFSQQHQLLSGTLSFEEPIIFIVIESKAKHLQ